MRRLPQVKDRAQRSGARLFSRLGERAPRCALCLLFPLIAAAQQPDMRQVLERLDRLEAQNQELLGEIRNLRQQLAAAQPPGVTPSSAEAATAQAQESGELQDRRLAELDQTKIGTDHRLPVSLTGMVLFNAFLNGAGSGGADNPTTAPATGRQASGGATMRQTILGLKFDGPGIPGGGKMTGSVYMDFFGGGTGLNQTFRLRVASLDAGWKNTTVSFAFDKPILAPREPESLAQVGVSPLTAAGNLWLWQPQVRLEQRFAIGDQAGLRAQVGLYQTSEAGTGLATDYGDTLARARPGYEGRFEFWSQYGGNRRIEIAPGFHVSSTRVLGVPVPSRIFSIDWLIRPVGRVDFTGTFFQGENVGVVGGLRQGVTVFRDRNPVAVDAMGGWAQVKVRITPRLSFNGFGGQEDDRNRQLDRGGIAKNQSYGANLLYRLGSNILTGLEAAQVRTTYIGSGTHISQHYDLAIAYLF
jgi:hypothetical protein